MTNQEIIERIKQDMSKGDVKVAVDNGYRYYTDTLTESIRVPLTNPEETAKLYKKLIIDSGITLGKTKTSVQSFDKLPRVSMYIGQPDTGKTYKAFKVAESFGVTPIFIMCRDNLNLETLLEDFVLIDGKPQYKESPAIKALTDPNKKEAIIIMDEFNTLLTGVTKTMQPLFDDTSKFFTYRGKQYEKNMNCKFFVTLNDKDKGISVLPNAILSRSHITYFPPVDVSTLSKWTNIPQPWITTLYNIYKLLGLLDIFGTRQIKIIKQLASVEDIKNHLLGLCTMRGVDTQVIETLQFTQEVNKL